MLFVSIRGRPVFSSRYLFAKPPRGPNSPVVGIHIDGLAFFRTRIDSDGGGRYPEFYDAETGMASNSSAGGLLRAGVNFWW